MRPRVTAIRYPGESVFPRVKRASLRLLLVGVATAFGGRALAVPVGDGRPSADIKPRFELRVSSVHRVHDELMRSHCRALVSALERLLVEAGQASAEGVDVGNAGAIGSVIADWPDAAIDAATFAPDLQGRARWAVQVNWPVDDLRDRINALLHVDAAASIFEGVSLGAETDGSYIVRLAGEPIAFVRSEGDGRSFLASHADLRPQPLTISDAPENDDAQAAPLVSARLNLARTETDSGATFLSSFSAVTAVDYNARVRPDGDWDESVQVHWPPISGMGAKALFDRVDQMFFVPDAAFGAAVINAPVAAGMFDGMAGLGPQVMMESPGKIEIVGEPMPGPLGAHVDSNVCFTLLPGTGFLPAPDVVIQARTRKADELVKALHEETKRINALFVDREQPEPWHEMQVRDRTVFWSDSAGAPRGVMMPFVMRPVLFTAKETDEKDRQREFLVLGMTTTDPAAFVERWLNLPRTKDCRQLPSVRKSYGQLWVRWRNVYDWVSPYLNLALSGAGIDASLPSADSMSSDLTDSLVSVKVRYSGLTANHTGPLPAGTVVLPSLLATSLAADESGGSDLARERLASRRLDLLYHHCRLFKKDIGRWPAEVGELDGYVDFEGHPELLELRLSAKRQWSQWLEGMKEAVDAAEKTEDGEPDAEINTDLYVIHWSRDRWTLGFKPGTFEHLERLYVDQDGEVHRVVKIESPKADDPESKTGQAKGKEVPPVDDSDGEKE